VWLLLLVVSLLNEFVGLLVGMVIGGMSFCTVPKKDRGLLFVVLLLVLLFTKLLPSMVLLVVLLSTSARCGKRSVMGGGGEVLLLLTVRLPLLPVVLSSGGSEVGIWGVGGKESETAFFMKLRR